MPIVSKELINLGEQADGTSRVREQHTDTLNKVWTFQYRAPSLAEATAIMNARDLTPQLKDRDIQDVLDHVALGFPNGPDTFEYTRPRRDATQIQAEVEIAVCFASMPGDAAAPIAWWIQTLDNTMWDTLRNRVGFTSQQAAAIRARVTNVITAQNTYNATVDDPR